jgi:LPXTG-site transpeptidase (sortase) family protein
MYSSRFSFSRVSLFILSISGLIVSVFQPQVDVFAAAALTVVPLTWNVIGLDSNNVSVGPNHFPVGARVCNTGDSAATNVTATFVWDSSNTYVNNRPGTNTTLSVSSLAAKTCTDFYFEVQVTRNALAYDTTRRYHVAVTADGGLSSSTPTPRELYVEHLVSQNRNAVTDVRFGTTLAALDLPASSVPAGGTMNLMVGNTYYIRMIGFTATQGYEQLESFINIPNTIFQVLSVSTTYTADTSAYVDSPNDKLYGDACKWENDPGSPNYRSCLDVGKVGGDIRVTYQVKILRVPGAPLVNPQPLSTLIYDFSGSSFHYNSDYGVSTRYANIINASLTKSFSPKTILPGETSTLTFTITNPGTSSISNVNFTDDLPTNLSLSNTNVAYDQCGSALPSTVSDPLSFSNITVAGNSTCTITVRVTSSNTGTYNNATGSLFIDTTNTGSVASDTLIVSSQPSPPSSCVTPTILASWTMPTSGQGSGGPPPPYTTRQSNVDTATASAVLTGAGSQAISATGVPANSWGITDAWPSVAGAPGATAAPYFDFVVDTSNYGGVRITFDRDLEAPGDWGNATNNVYVYSSADGGAFSTATAVVTTKGLWQTGATVTAASTGSSTTRFTIHADTRNSAKTTSTVYLDNIVITGCSLPTVPNLSKSFLPISIGRGNTSTLTFVITNPNTGSSLSGVSFSDVLPSGLTVSSLSSSTCGGTLTTSAPRTISFSGGTLAPSASCTINVTVTGAAAGTYTNVSSSVSSTETGPNTASTGIGTSTLTVTDPPVIAKSFTANPIFTGNTTTLNFTITNPNTSTALSGVTFTDTLPTGLVVATPDGLSNTCGGTVTAIAGSITLSGVTLSAGSSCILSINVQGTTTGVKTNSVTVSSSNGGTGNTATANVLVKDPAPAISLLKQIGTSASGPWSSFLAVSAGANVYYRFAVENIGDVPLSAVSVSDDTLSLAGCSWVDGDNTPLTAPFALPVADVSNNQLATCVLGPFTTSSGLHTNHASASGTYITTTVTDSSSAAYGTPAITLTKSVTEPFFTAEGNLLHYSYLVTNSGSASLLGPVTVSDNKTTVACPAVNTIGDNDDWLDIGESITCTATYTVVAGDVSAGTITNTATAAIGGATSNLSSTTIGTPADLTVTKTNNVSGVVAVGSSFTWTLTVSNSGNTAATFTSGQTILSDPLPAGPVYSVPAVGSFVNITNSANISCGINSGTLTCIANSASVTIGSPGSFVVSITATPATASSLVNTATVDPNSNVPEASESNNTGSNTVNAVAPPSIAKSFSPNPAVIGSLSTLTFTITNVNLGLGLSGVAFMDTLPTGITLSADVITPQCGGTITGAAGDNVIVLNGGTIPANSTCTVTAAVIASGAGTYVNTTQNVSSTNAGTGNTATSTLYVFEAAPSKSLVTTSEGFTGAVASTERVAIGEMIRYRLSTKLPEGSLTNLQLTDDLPNGLQFLNDNTTKVAFVCNGSPGCISSSTLSGAGLVIGGNSDSISPTFDLPGAATSGGPFGSGTNVTFSFGNLTNSDSDADAEYIVVEFNAIVLNVNSTATVNQGVDNDPASGIPGQSNTNLRPNGVTLRVDGSQVGSSSANVTVSIAEPAITAISKSVSPVGPYYAGDTLTYTLTFSNNATGNNATTAFDIVLTDTFDSNLAVGAVNVSSTQGGTCAGGTVFSANTSTTGQLVTVNVSCLDAAQSVTVTVDATINAGTASSTSISNNASLSYTSLPGSQGNCAAAPFSCASAGSSGSGTGERNGSGGPGADGAILNNYAVTSNTTITVVSATATPTPTDAPTNTPTDTPTNTPTDTPTLTDTPTDTPTNTPTATPTPTNTPTDTPTATNAPTVTVTPTDTPTDIPTDTPTSTSTATPTSTPTNTPMPPVQVIDPALSKTGDPTRASVGETVTFTLVITNNGNAPAPDVVVTDVLPSQFDVTEVRVTGNVPLGTVVNVTPLIGTGTAPYTVVVTLGGSLGVSDIVTIDIVTEVNGTGTSPVNNTATLTTSAQTDIVSNNTDSVAIAVRKRESPSLPDTGFAKGIKTLLGEQPADLRYNTTAVILEIPSLHVKIPIVGVPKKNGMWNVSWLGNQAGWLEGSAFPSWNGNSVLTGHVYLASGLPGPFVDLNGLKYGDKIIIHAYGQRYTFAVQTNKLVNPDDKSVLKHEEKPWLTLITCKDYDEKTDRYKKRVVVRSVLVRVEWDR